MNISIKNIYKINDDRKRTLFLLTFETCVSKCNVTNKIQQQKVGHKLIHNINNSGNIK